MNEMRTTFAPYVKDSQRGDTVGIHTVVENADWLRPVARKQEKEGGDDQFEERIEQLLQELQSLHQAAEAMATEGTMGPQALRLLSEGVARGQKEKESIVLDISHAQGGSSDDTTTSSPRNTIGNGALATAMRALTEVANLLTVLQQLQNTFAQVSQKGSLAAAQGAATAAYEAGKKQSDNDRQQAYSAIASGVGAFVAGAGMGGSAFRTYRTNKSLNDESNNLGKYQKGFEQTSAAEDTVMRLPATASSDPAVTARMQAMRQNDFSAPYKNEQNPALHKDGIHYNEEAIAHMGADERKSVAEKVVNKRQKVDGEIDRNLGMMNATFQASNLVSTLTQSAGQSATQMKISENDALKAANEAAKVLADYATNQQQTNAAKAQEGALGRVQEVSKAYDAIGALGSLNKAPG